MAETIRWGVLGAGRIAERFARSLERRDDACLYAIAGRSPEKLAAFAKTHPAEKRYTDFEAFLQDPNIDAVYLALPHGLHYPWLKKLMAAGKPVLCEKPLVLNAGEAEDLLEYHKEHPVLVMEAMKGRFVPARDELFALLRDGAIGPLRSVEVSFCYQLPEAMKSSPALYINQPEQGGAWLDVGCYGANFLLDLFDLPYEVRRIDSVFENGVDAWVRAELDFSGVKGVVEAGIDRDKPHTGIVEGEKGCLVIDVFNRPARFTIYAEGQAPQVYEVPYEGDDFSGEIGAFMDALRRKESENGRMTLQDSLDQARLLDAVRKIMNRGEEV